VVLSDGWLDQTVRDCRWVLMMLNKTIFIQVHECLLTCTHSQRNGCQKDA
jgi:hypothetical protein